MTTLTEVEKAALSLPEGERALLAERLLDSLPPTEYDDDDDEGIAIALARDAELDRNPEIAISLEEFERRIEQRRNR